MEMLQSQAADVTKVESSNRETAPDLKNDGIHLDQSDRSPSKRKQSTNGARRRPGKLKTAPPSRSIARSKRQQLLRPRKRAVFASTRSDAIATKLT